MEQNPNSCDTFTVPMPEDYSNVQDNKAQSVQKQNNLSVTENEQNLSRRKNSQNLVELHLQLCAGELQNSKFRESQQKNCNLQIQNEWKVDQAENTTTKKSEKKGCKRYLGIILAIISVMPFPLISLIVKTSNFNPYSVTFWRFQGIFLPALIIAFYNRVVKKRKIFDSVWPPTKKGHPKTLLLLFFRCVFGASGTVLHFISLKFLSVADTTVISSSTPVFVSLASHFLLGEKSGFVPILCGIITFGGVAAITRPPILTGGEGFDTNTLIGCAFSLSCMITTTCIYVLLRFLRQIHFSVINSYLGMWGSLQSLILAFTLSEFQIPKDKEELQLIASIAVLTFIGQTCVTLALKYEQAGIVSLCRSCGILFAFLWQLIFLGETPDYFSMIGGIVVIVGVVVAGLRKFVSELPEESNAKRRLCILLI